MRAVTVTFMTFPVVDQYASAEWMLYAEQLMHDVGFLKREPTGSYDDEFRAALEELQVAGGIYDEPQQVGPRTWGLLLPYGPTGGEPAEPQQLPEAQPEQPYAEDQQYFYEQPPAPVVADPGRSVRVHGNEYVIYPDEVRRGGSSSWRGRNPGRIRHGDSYGAYPGKQVHTSSHGTFAVFPTEEEGFQAIKAVLRHYGNVTVAQAVHRYARASDHDELEDHARSVAHEMGVSARSHVDTLDDGQLDVFASAIGRIGGWREGHVFALDDPDLPAEVQQAIRGG